MADLELQDQAGSERERADARAGALERPAALIDASADSATPYLLYNDGSGVQLFYPLPETRPVTVGRDSGADVTLPWDASVSSLHAEVRRLAAHVLISDEGISRNGTYVNDERVSGRRRLRHGDVIRVGKTLLAFHDPKAAVARSSTTEVDVLGALGTVTVLFTDLVGSTQLLSRLGEQAGERVLHTHFALLREVSRAHGGIEVKSLGDGLMLVFASARRAVACALEMQRRMLADSEVDRAAQGMRIGLNAGEVIRAERDYFGMPVVVAKRLCDAAEPGQTLVSDIVRSLVGNQPDFRFLPLSPVTLKGVAEPVGVFELTLSG